MTRADDMLDQDHAWDRGELDLLEAGKQEAPPASSAESVFASLGLQGPPASPTPGPAGQLPAPAPAASGVFLRPAAWAGAAVVALALIPLWPSLTGGEEQADPGAAAQPSPAQPEKLAADGSSERGLAADLSDARQPETEPHGDSSPAERGKPAETTPIDTSTGLGRTGSQQTSTQKPPAAKEAATQVPAASRPSLAEELAVLKKARSLLNSGNLSGTEAALAAHKKRFAPARLSTEALVIRVELLLKQGKRTQAKRLVAPLMKADSPYRARMETLLSSR